jgi:uncharacterized phage protein (TIGR01671 family)
MREIKFRAWSYKESKFYTRVLVGNVENDDPCSSVWDDEKKEWLEFDKFCGVIQQYTGLKDKNGKEIYEGDKVKFGYTENRDFFGEVVYFEDRATFGVKTKNAGEDFDDLVDYMHFFEVIGNIFENQEHSKQREN